MLNVLIRTRLESFCGGKEILRKLLGSVQKHVFLLHVLNKNHNKVLTALYASNWVLSVNRKK